MAALPGDVPRAERARRAEEIASEIAHLKGEYRRVLALQADEDYSRRRAEWRAQQGRGRGAGRRCSGASACA